MENNFQNEIEKIRKKTFNPELQKLVNGVILKDEPGKNREKDKYVLLEEIHDLFYKALNLNYSEGCNDSDFRYDMESDENGSSDFPGLFIKNSVILEYNEETEVYEVTQSLENDEFREKLIFCPSEEIYKRIFSAGKPVKLDENFLRSRGIDKRFSFLAGYNFYAVSFNSMLKNTWSRYVKFSGTFDFSKFNPIIFFSLKTGTTEDTFMKKYISPFYMRLYAISALKIHKKAETGNIRTLLERYAKEMSVFDDVYLYVIKIKKDFSTEFYFLLKFLKNKLNKSVLNPSRIALADKDTFIAFINNADSRKFLEEVDDFSCQYDYCLDIIKINDFQNADISRIIHEAKL
ncbi:MAG: hypothetical protein JW982_13465 [Spirochaetes bacterium]|nr:hypothetical protein [Spirochaetota bacterium]